MIKNVRALSWKPQYKKKYEYTIQFFFQDKLQEQLLKHSHISRIVQKECQESAGQWHQHRTECPGLPCCL